jgi:ATP-dependent HslUV protease subunit HslV
MSPYRHSGQLNAHGNAPWHGTTIVAVRTPNAVVIAGDGQVSMGPTIVKGNARKVRRLGKNQVIAGFAGATADAMTLFERLDTKLEQHPGQLARACVELAKDWRTDRYLRRLEALMAVADRSHSLILSGTGDVLEPEDGIIGIGSGGTYALAAARALASVAAEPPPAPPADDPDRAAAAGLVLDAETIARRALGIAADICVYTNHSVTLERIEITS